MTPLTQCQTQHKNPKTREKIVAAAHAEAQTAIVTKTAKVTVKVTATETATETAIATKAAAKVDNVPRSSAQKHRGPRANTLQPN